MVDATLIVVRGRAGASQEWGQVVHLAHASRHQSGSDGHSMEHTAPVHVSTIRTMEDGERSMIKTAPALAVLGSLAFALSACDVEQTEEGELPEVQGGEMPAYDVDTADVEVKTEERTVDVPVVETEEADASAE